MTELYALAFWGLGCPALQFSDMLGVNTQDYFKVHIVFEQKVGMYVNKHVSVSSSNQFEIFLQNFSIAFNENS